MIDDSAPVKAAQENSVTFRITIVKVFASDALVARAAAKLITIPSLVLGETAKKIESTKGALEILGV